MRKKDIFKKLFVCIIENNQIDKYLLIETLQLIGIKNFIYYISFKDALKDFEKFYSIREPDFIMSEWYMEEFTDPDWLEMYYNNRLSNIPLLLLTCEDETNINDHAKCLKLSGIIKKPIALDKIRSGIMKIFKRKFSLIN